MVTVATTQLSHCSTKAAMEHTLTNGCGYVPIKFYLRKQVASWIWSKGYKLPNLVSNYYM